MSKLKKVATQAKVSLAKAGVTKNNSKETEAFGRDCSDAPVDDGAQMSSNDAEIDEESEDSSALGEANDSNKPSRRGRRLALIACIVLFFCFAVNYSGPLIQQINYWLNGTYETSAGVYSGDMADGHFEGKGTFTFNTGEVYKGAWRKGVMEGTGSLQYPSIGKYKGSYSDGKRSGQGTFTWRNGDSYTGAWDSDEMSGEGTYTFADGLELVGVFSHNRYYSGSVSIEDGNRSCVITYENGAPAKIDIQDKLTGDKYSFKGSFSNSFLREGSLEITNSSGSYRIAVSNSTMTNMNAQLTDGSSYSGEYSDSGLSGEGVLIDASGNKYEGSFSSGVKSGNGLMNWANGASYSGKWSNDTMDGQGEYHYAPGSSGSKLVGNFSNGKPDGECTWYQSDGTSYKTVWENGTCVKVIE